MVSFTALRLMIVLVLALGVCLAAPHPRRHHHGHHDRGHHGKHHGHRRHRQVEEKAVSVETQKSTDTFLPPLKPTSPLDAEEPPFDVRNKRYTTSYNHAPPTPEHVVHHAPEHVAHHAPPTPEHAVQHVPVIVKPHHHTPEYQYPPVQHKPNYRPNYAPKQYYG